MCQLDWAMRSPDILLNFISGVSGRMVLDEINSGIHRLVKQKASPVWTGLIQPTADLNRTEGWVGEFSPHLPVSELGHWSPALRLGLEFTPSAPPAGSPACWLHILGLLNLHNQVSKFCPFFVCLNFGFIYLFIYSFMAVLGLCFCARAFSSCGKWGPLFIAVCGPLTIAASPVAEHRLQKRRLSSCGSRA